MGEIKVGTSGFQFQDWKGSVYPPGLPDRDMLGYYERVFGFNVLEVNYTYYRIPSAAAMERMLAKTSEAFDFVVRSYSGMTHEIWADEGRKVLKDTSSIFRQFRNGLSPMREAGRLGCVLIQFPSFFWPGEAHRDYIERCRDWLAGIPLVIEFRNKAWVHESTFNFLRDHNVGFCAVDEPALPRLMPFVPQVTTSIGYVRLHGRNTKWFSVSREERYNYLYSEAELASFVTPVRQIGERTVKTYVFFNNCHAGHAVKNALMFKKMLGMITKPNQQQESLIS